MSPLRLDGVDEMSSALIVVDVQPDFMPGGALPVEDGGAILPGIRALMESGPFGTIVATQDWHPVGHVSFATSHPGTKPFQRIELHGHEQTLWPDHCVQGSGGAGLHADLPWERAAAILRKGEDPRCDSYSGFRNNFDERGQRPPTGLAGFLRERGIETVHVCGLARDVCCKWTAQDAIREGFRTRFLWDLCRSVNPDDDAGLRRELERGGIVILEGVPG